MGYPSVFNYLDYRQYLCDLFHALKQEDRRFSYRKFSRLAGSSSPNFLQLVRDRILNIRPKGIDAIARAFNLTKKERTYFATIIAFDHAKSHTAKDKFFRHILATRQNVDIKQLEKKQYAYFSHWYIPVIRELVTCQEYPDAPSWIADRITPPIAESKVRRGIELLASLGLIRREEQTQRWIQTDAVISTPSEVLSVAVAKYHRDTIALGRDAIDRFPPSQRDIRSVTLGISKNGYQEMKQRLEAFWKEILAFSATQQNAKDVYQVNMQFFPLTGEKRKRRRV